MAIVTSAGSSISEATAMVLAANDLTVLATDIDDALADTEAIASVLNVADRVETVSADLTNDDIELSVECAADAG